MTKRLLIATLLCLALGCATHVVQVEAGGPGKATFDIPRVEYLAVEGDGTLTVRLDSAEVYVLNVHGRKAWHRVGAKLNPVEWSEAAAALGLPQ